MKITRVRLFEVELPLVHSFQTSSHKKSSLTHILVELTDEHDSTGWGEVASPTHPYFTSETTDTAWLMATGYLVQSVLGVEWEHPGDVDGCWAKIRGHEFAKAGFAGAAWDLWAKANSQSLAAGLGGTRSVVRSGVSLGIEPTIDILLDQVDKQVSAGYGRVKLKIAPDWDVLPVQAVRQAYPALDLHVDANGAYGSDTSSMDRLAQLDAYGLTMIEQPFAPRDFPAHARLQERIATAVCLDEAVVQLDDLRTMIAMKAGRVLNIKVSRMAGLTVAKAAHDLAWNEGIPVWCGGMHEFGIGRAGNVALSSLPNFTLPSDVSGSDKYYARDVITPAITARDGAVDVPTGPGIGFEIDHAWIAHNQLRYFDSEVPADQSGRQQGTAHEY